jgi:hypothetical protein
MATVSRFKRTLLAITSPSAAHDAATQYWLRQYQTKGVAMNSILRIAKGADGYTFSMSDLGRKCFTSMISPSTADS